MAQGEAIVIGYFLVVANAEKNVLQVAVFGANIMHVIGGNQRDTGFARDLNESGIGDHLVFVVAMRLEFEEKVSRAENMLILKRRFSSAFFASGNDERWHFAGHRSGESDESFVVFPQQVFVDARLVVEPLDVRRGNNLHEVLVAGLCFGEENKVGAAPVFHGDAAPHICRYVYFRADNRFHVSLFCLYGELDGAIECSVVGEGERRHAEFLGTIKQGVDASGRREKAIVRVNVEVSERHIRILP